MVIIDTIIDAKSEDNLSTEKCKEWWENQQQKDYFGPKKLDNPQHFHLSQPKLLEQAGLNKDSEVLEIGCGFGREIKSFLKMTDTVFGVDISKTAAKLTKKNCPEAHIEVYDGTHLPFSDNNFNLVYSCFVIQHMSKANAIELIKETIRVLKPKGRFLFEFLGGHGCAGEGKEHYSGGLTGMYNNGYTSKEIEDLITDLKLNKVFLEEKILGNGPEAISNFWLCCEKGD